MTGAAADRGAAAAPAAEPPLTAPDRTSGAGTGNGARDQIDFVSVDSAPKRFAVFVPKWRGLAVLAAFAAIATLLLWLRQMAGISTLLPHHDLVFTDFTGSHSVAVRIFVLSFYLAFAPFAAGRPWGKVLFALDLILTFVVFCAAFDLTGALMSRLLGITYSIHFIEIISGIAGFGIYSFKLMERGRMPSRIKVEHVPGGLRKAILRLTFAIVSSVALTVWVISLNRQIVEDMRNVALLGGIGPGVFMVLPVVFLQLYLFALWDRARTSQKHFAPAVSIIVPAYNEQYIIERTIRAMDVAADAYEGEVTILIMDNNSTDDTAAIAARALAECTHATGRVIAVPTPGKSHALNAGMEAVETEFMIRADADTLLGPDNIVRAMRHFANPRVGVVGGVPVPPGGGPFDRARLMEVLTKHGFYSVAYSAVDSVVGIPGMFTVYRTEQPRYLGGFVEGMNGEDTDVSLRIGELGYHSVVDPGIRYISEVPMTYGHMREQRMRWFRSVYHVSARNRDLIYSPWLTLRGKILLPFMLINSGRRAMLVPLLIFGLIEYFGAFNPASLVTWQALLALMVGAPAVLAVVAALLNGVPRAILCIPEYLLFRMLRAYFTLESMLSISLTSGREDLSVAWRDDIVTDKLVRVA